MIWRHSDCNYEYFSQAHSMQSHLCCNENKKSFSNVLSEKLLSLCRICCTFCKKLGYKILILADRRRKSFSQHDDLELKHSSRSCYDVRLVINYYPSFQMTLSVCRWASEIDLGCFPNFETWKLVSRRKSTKIRSLSVSIVPRVTLVFVKELGRFENDMKVKYGCKLGEYHWIDVILMSYVTHIYCFTLLI